MGTSWIDGLQLRMTHREIRMTILNDLQFSISGEILEITTFGMLGYVDMYLDDGISWSSLSLLRSYVSWMYPSFAWLFIPLAELHYQVDSLTSTCAHMIWDVDLGIVGTVCVLQTVNYAGS